MNAHEAIKTSMQTPDMIWQAYLGDLEDADLFIRPTEGANHIAWQLGHLIVSEHGLIESVCPGTMPALPDGFAEQYTKDTSAGDDPAQFHTKNEYIRLATEQRAGTLAAMDALSAEDLDAPSPEHLSQLGPNVAAIFSMQPTHWTMHAGQWAVIRRKLGKPPLF
jgi:hypothetical protein